MKTKYKILRIKESTWEILRRLAFNQRKKIIVVIEEIVKIYRHNG